MPRERTRYISSSMLSHPFVNRRVVPSIKVLMRDLKIDKDKARQVHKALSAFREDGDYPSSEEVETALQEVNRILDQHGVEAIFASSACYQPVFSYVNNGESYDATVVFDRLQWRFLVSSWAARMEHWERIYGRFDS